VVKILTCSFCNVTT